MKTVATLVVASLAYVASANQDITNKPPKPLRAVVLNGKPIIVPLGGKAEVGFINEQLEFINEIKPAADKGGAELPFIEIESLAMAINGTPNLAPTMKLGPNGLIAVTAGGCGACALAIKVEGVIGKVITKGGKRYVAVGDVARSLGARLGPVGDHGASLVGGGDFKCRECAILFVK